MYWMHVALGVLLWAAGALSALLEGSVKGLIPTDYYVSSLAVEDVTTSQVRRYPFRPNGTFAVMIPETPEGFILSLESSSLNIPWRYHVISKAESDILIFKVLKGHGINDHAAQLGQPLTIAGSSRKQLVVERPVFSLWQMIRSPSVAMSLVALGMVFIAPKLSSLVDMEALEESAQNQEGGPPKVASS